MKLMSEAQTAGPLIVLSAFVSAEMSARLLDTYPSAAVAWYLNLEVFRAFEIVRGETSPVGLLIGPGSLGPSLVLIVLVVLFRITRFQLGIAFLANLSFMIAVTLAYSWFHGASITQTASLAEIGAGSVYDSTLLAILLTTSFTAFLMSHVSFVRKIRLSL